MTEVNKTKDNINKHQLTKEELQYKHHNIPLLNDLGMDHFDLIERRFKFISLLEFKYWNTPYDEKLSDQYRKEKYKLDKDSEYAKRMFWVRERYIDLVESGELDGEKMTKDDFKRIFDLTEAEFGGIAYSVFMFGKGDTPFD
jgi:hypothetical protein